MGITNDLWITALAKSGRLTDKPKGEGMIKKARVKIRGVRPALWHHFSAEILSSDRKTKTGTAGNDPEEWKKTVLFDKETRQLYFQPLAIFSLLKAAAAYSKAGKGSIKTKVAATLEIDDLPVLVTNRKMPPEDKIDQDKTKPVYIDVTSVVNPSTKGRNLRYRVAASKGWECEFKMQFDDTIVSEKQMQQVVTDAGTLIGLSDGRSIGFGRFEVVEFKII